MLLIINLKKMSYFENCGSPNLSFLLIVYVLVLGQGTAFFGSKVMWILTRKFFMES